MYGRQKGLEVAARRRARREREDGFARLHDEVPRLATLSFEIAGRQGKTTLTETKHVRRFVVEQAPALFEMRCTNGGCAEGGHDVTRQVLEALRKDRERFEVESPCQAGCGRTLHIIASATYR